MKESGADAVKLEGGIEIQESVDRILSAGIPVMGHLGLMPQSINKFGTYTVRATDPKEAEKIYRMPQFWKNMVALPLSWRKFPLN
jgi:3-methyl-2-oxobutanoate hydroxymethyltransferase